jgi:hypothetical protein
MRTLIATGIWSAPSTYGGRSSVSFSLSHCFVHNTDWLNSSNFIGCFAGASLGVSCNYEQTRVYRNTCCVWECSVSQSHHHTKGRYVLWWSWTVFRDSCNAHGLLDVCFLLKDSWVLLNQFYFKITSRYTLLQYKLFL